MGLLCYFGTIGIFVTGAGGVTVIVDGGESGFIGTCNEFLAAACPWMYPNAPVMMDDPIVMTDGALSLWE
jgi:hypothetical protein